MSSVGCSLFARKMSSPQRSSLRWRSLSVSSLASWSSEPERSNAEANGLEASLFQLISNHNHASRMVMLQIEKAKKDAIGKAVQVSNALVEAVNGRVRDSFINEKRIEHEIRALVVSITRFMKQTDRWLAATHALNTAVKEIGDFENWMKTMEYDCKNVCAAIHNIH